MILGFMSDLHIWFLSFLSPIMITCIVLVPIITPGSPINLLVHLPFVPIRPIRAKLVVPSLRYLLQYSLKFLAET